MQLWLVIHIVPLLCVVSLFYSTLYFIKLNSLRNVDDTLKKELLTVSLPNIVIPSSSLIFNGTLKEELTAVTSHNPVASSSSDTSAEISDIVLPSFKENKDDDIAIPRILHYVWPNKNFTFEKERFKSIEIKTHRWVNSVKALNPDWEVHVWTDKECHKLVEEHFPSFYPLWKELTPKLKMWDAVRPVILHVYGGIYLDHDITCIGIGFSEWIDPGTRLMIRKENYDGGSGKKRITITNSFMASAKSHPLWLTYIENIIKEIPFRDKVFMHTGPGQMYKSFKEHIAQHQEEKDSIKKLLPHEMPREKAECLKYVEKINLNKVMCNRTCVHVTSVSPAEINYEDDIDGFLIGQIRSALQLNDVNGTVTKRNGTRTVKGRRGRKLPRMVKKGKRTIDSSSQRFQGRKRYREEADPRETLAMEYNESNSGDYDFPKIQCGCERLRAFYHNTKVAYVHIPKTGGTSVENAMGVVEGDGVRGHSCHATAAIFSFCGDHDFSELFSFTVLRHPVDRAISMYKYAKMGGNGGTTDRAKFSWVSNLDFTSFVENLSQRQEYVYAPQARWVKGYNTEQVIIKHIMCLDTLASDWEELKSIVHVMTNMGDIPHNRVSDNYNISINEVTVESLKNIYEDDYVLWGQYCGNRGSIHHIPTIS